MDKIFEISTNINTPIGLASLSLLILYIIFRRLLKLKIFTKQREDNTYKILTKIINYVFITVIICLLFLFFYNTNKEDSKKITHNYETEGIYLSDYIGDTFIESDSTFASIWITANGNSDYFINKIKINHFPGRASSMGTGKLLPDADYQFFFEFASNEIHALNPALYIRKDDRRTLFFTLGLSPKGSFSSVGGELLVLIEYNSSNGSQGYIPLIKLSQLRGGSYLKDLSISLDQDILVSKVIDDFRDEKLDVIIGANGYIKGVDYTKELPPMFNFLHFEHFYIRNEYFKDSRKEIQIENYKSRIALHNLLIQENKIDNVIDLIKKKNYVALDLCIGINDQKCVDIFLDDEFKKIWGHELTQALIKRHYIFPNEMLANLILEIKVEDIKDAGLVYRITESLAYNPIGKWQSALLKLFKMHPTVIRAFILNYKSIRDDISKELIKICISHIKNKSYGFSSLKHIYLFLILKNQSNFLNEIPSLIKSYKQKDSSYEKILKEHNNAIAKAYEMIEIKSDK